MTGLLFLGLVLLVAAAYGLATCSHVETYTFTHEAFGHRSHVKRCKRCGENVQP